MKKIMLLLTVLLGFIHLNYAQSPKFFNYQSVVRDNSGKLIQNKAVTFRFSIVEGNINGLHVYIETQLDTTNSFGLCNLIIGKGQVVSGNFNNINWGKYNYFLRIELDANGGQNFVFMGISQFLSVPYALYADKAGNVNNNDTSSTNEIQYLAIKNNDLTISQGNTVNLPVKIYYPGNGITVNDSIIINTAPDKTVSLTGTGKISVSGTYPNFTISSACDTSNTNELQILSVRKDTLFLSKGNFVKLPFNDTSTTNELQVLSISKDTLFISKGNFVKLPIKDTSNTNELQFLSISGDSLYISKGNAIKFNSPNEYAIFEEQYSTGTYPGNFGSTGWVVRSINTTVVISGNSISRTLDAFTLTQGTYRITASAPARNCYLHKIRLYNITDATTMLIGTTGDSQNGSIQSLSYIDGIITITGTKMFYIQHKYNGTLSSPELGIAGNITGTNEVYTRVYIEKIR